VETIGSKRSYALTWCMPNNDDDDDELCQVLGITERQRVISVPGGQLWCCHFIPTNYKQQCDKGIYSLFSYCCYYLAQFLFNIEISFRVKPGPPVVNFWKSLQQYFTGRVFLLYSDQQCQVLKGYSLCNILYNSKYTMSGKKEATVFLCITLTNVDTVS